MSPTPKRHVVARRVNGTGGLSKECVIAATCLACNLFYSAGLIEGEERPFDRLARQGRAHCIIGGFFLIDRVFGKQAS